MYVCVCVCVCVRTRMHVYTSVLHLFGRKNEMFENKFQWISKSYFKKYVLGYQLHSFTQ